MKIVKIAYYILLLLVCLCFSFILIFPANSFSIFLYRLFGLVCHQGDTVLLNRNIITLPLCIRCTGIYLFPGAGSLAAELFGRRIKPGVFILIMCVGALPLILDGFLKFSRLPGFGIISFITGALFGFTCGAAIVYGMNGIIKSRKSAG